MKIPKTINVSGYVLTIKQFKKIVVNSVECFGTYNPNDKTISLKIGMSPTQKKEIFIHEYLHFLEDIYRIKISEESIAFMAVGMLKLILDKRVRFND